MDSEQTTDGRVAEVILRTCDGTQNQSWTVDKSANNIVNDKSHLCIAAY